jgi:2-polyprenyl-6-methoxyphenol hydroxylase-like FAD-dependent oxidoreductase
MNHGIADAVVMVKEITAASKGEKSLSDAIKAYQDEMISRAGEEVQISVGNTQMLHDWEKAQMSPLLQRGGDPNAPKK